jgi:hypothetical protein
MRRTRSSSGRFRNQLACRCRLSRCCPVGARSPRVSTRLSPARMVSSGTYKRTIGGVYVCVLRNEAAERRSGYHPLVRYRDGGAPLMAGFHLNGQLHRPSFLPPPLSQHLPGSFVDGLEVGDALFVRLLLSFFTRSNSSALATVCLSFVAHCLLRYRKRDTKQRAASYEPQTSFTRNRAQ